MGLTDFDLKGGFDETLNRIKAPFDRFFAAPLDMAGAVYRNDYPNGFEMVEIEDGVVKDADKVILIGSSMPQQPFTFGGEQQIVKDYYPGNTEPSVHVLGPRESDITIKGRIHSKRFTSNPSFQKKLDSVDEKEGNKIKETFRKFAREKQKLIEAMRIRGNLVRITLGEFQRFGFIESTKFDLKTEADIDYNITFTIIGFNPPSDCKVLGRARTIPFDINNTLIEAGDAFSAFTTKPPTIPRSLSEQLDDAIGSVAAAIGLVTGFVDNVLNEVDNLKASVARAEGLVKNARATISSFQRRVGSFDPGGGFDNNAGNGVAGSYINADYMADLLASVFAISAILAQLVEEIQKTVETTPLATHIVQAGDTLQSLAQKFYADAQQWEEIYDHNKLQDTDLTSIVGETIEIPGIF